MIFIPLLRKKNPITCNMKKILVAIAAMLITFGASAQNYKTEISVAYGAFSNAQIISAIALAYSDVGDPSFEFETFKFVGPISADLYFRTSRYFSFGLSGVYQHNTGKVSINKGASEDFNCRYITVMPGMKLHWLRTNGFNMYSKLAVGPTFSIADSGESGWGLDWQISPIGLEFGRNFCVFAEAGFGEQGIVLGGIRIKL